jgi:hypothetical protein
MVKADANTVYRSVNSELKKILGWCKQSGKEEAFDLDGLYSRLFKEYNIDMNYGFLNPIFTLVDVMCDSIRHGQVNIKDTYSVKEGITDLEEIINHIDTYKIQELENNVRLKQKLNGLYD